MKAALAFFSAVVVIGLLGLLTADTSFGRTLSSPPITGPWSGGGHQFRITGTLEGGFTINAASSWQIIGCPINSGDVLFKYVPKGGSSYDLTWIVVWATTTQGQEGVKCEYTYDGPKTVTVTRSATGALNIACLGSACSSTGALKLVAPTTPKPTTTKPKLKPKPKPKDTLPPRVTAFTTKGFAQQGGSVALQFTLKDDSGRAKVHYTVYEGGKKPGSTGTTWLSAEGVTGVKWPIGANQKGPLYFCVWAEDAAGNKSSENRSVWTPLEFRDEKGRSCAWIPLIVPVEQVSNTCGGEGWDAFVEVQHYFGNVHTYTDSNTDSLAPSYTVDFSQACNLHDAGYGGYAVWDGINGGKPLDMRTWTRPQVDKKFLENMQKLCAAGIPATAKIALAKCNGTGGPASYGAKKLFDLVAKIGWRFFDADLTKPGLQKSGHRPNFD